MIYLMIGIWERVYYFYTHAVLLFKYKKYIIIRMQSLPNGCKNLQNGLKYINIETKCKINVMNAVAIYIKNSCIKYIYYVPIKICLLDNTNTIFQLPNIVIVIGVGLFGLFYHNIHKKNVCRAFKTPEQASRNFLQHLFNID